MAGGITWIKRTAGDGVVRVYGKFQFTGITEGATGLPLDTYIHATVNNIVFQSGTVRSSGAYIVISGMTSNDTGTVEVIGT